MQIIEKNKNKATESIFRLAFSILDNSAAVKKKFVEKHSVGKLYLAAERRGKMK